MTLPVRLLVLLLLSLAVFPGRAAAQDAAPGQVRGTVADTAGRPLAAAAVTVRSEADSVVAGRAATGADGTFRVGGLVPGRYRVEVSRPGFARQTRGAAVSAAALVADLGTVRLAPAAVALEGLEVRTERSPVSVAVDRTLYSTRDMPVAAGGTATDVMRNVPELEVDINGRVSLRGSTGVTIHLNGRPAPVRGEGLATFLQQFPANRIERIEVIPNPSARYDPDGTAGIVNIVLKENMDLGLSGNVSLNAGTVGTTGVGGRLAYQRGRLTLFGGGNMNWSRRRSTSYDLRQNLAASPVTFLEQDGRYRNDGHFGMVDGSAEVKTGKRTTAWSTLSVYLNGSDGEGTTAYLLMDAARAPTERYDRVTSSGWSGLNTDAGVGLRYQIEPQRHELTVEARRNGGRSDTDGRFLRHALGLDGDPLDAPAELTVNESEDLSGDLTLQADYTRPLGKNGKVEAGYRGTLRDTEDDDRLSVFPSESAPVPAWRTGSGYLYEEDFHSLYVTLGHRLGKLGVQAGVRAEQADTRFELRPTGERFDNDYGSVFPSANLSYDFGGGRQARLNYSKRIERPWPFFLNPYVPSADPLNRSVGNPSLKPKYTHSLSLDASWTGPAGTLRVSP
ncbi:MAG TPA: TonB-dependent receptor, partial [Longimicrobiaceae bacterium]